VQLILCKDSIKGGDYKMKMVFLLKNNARKGMGGKGVLKKGEEKEAEKGLQNSRILKRMAGWAEIRKF
jgi:hypothetical protein